MREEKAALCRKCGEIQLVKRHSSDFDTHLWLTVCTCCLWSPVFLVAWLISLKGWACTKCGSIDIVDNEPIAKALLREAKGLLGKNDRAAEKRLRELLKNFPETQSAAAAEKLIDKHF